MRVFEKISKVLMWIFMGFYLLVNAAAVYSLDQNNRNAEALGRPAGVYNYVPMILAVLVVLAACILFVTVKKWRPVWVGLAAAGAVVMLAVVLDLRQNPNFAVQISVSGLDRGLSDWKLAWRHGGIALVPICMGAAWLFGRLAERDEERQRVASGARRRFDLSGDSVFKDRDQNGREKKKEAPADREATDEELDTPYIVPPEEEEPPVRRVKRSVRQRQEKEDSQRK